MTMAAHDRYRVHGAWTDPGEHSCAILELPDDVASLVQTVRGLLIHSDFLDLYELRPDDIPDPSRETLSVAARLTQVLTRDASPLTVSRLPANRSAATCRDYALMICALLREKGFAARVRCGFARYFTPGGFEDHWVCQYWNESTDRWSLVDGQLDAETHRHLGIGFNTVDLPEGQFLTADQAWRLWRSGLATGREFSHGADDGAWLLAVNLARDALSLQSREVSVWDGWRDATPEIRQREPVRTDAFDGLAERVARADEQPDALDVLPQTLEDALHPFWLARPG